MEAPVSIKKLAIVGYADVLPNRKGPAILPPIFRDKDNDNRFYVPPFQLAGNWLIEAKCVSKDEIEELNHEKRITLTPKLEEQAQPHYQFWINENGDISYRPMDEGILALQRGKIDVAEKHAGIALSANERSLEPRVLMAACHALRKEGKEVIYLRRAAASLGHTPAAFSSLFKSYLEKIDFQIWNKTTNLEDILNICESIEANVWIPFRVTKKEYEGWHPLFHDHSLRDAEGELVVTCKGVEALLMSQRAPLKIALEAAKAYMSKGAPINALAAAGDFMLLDPKSIAQKARRSEAEIFYLGKMVRQQVSPRIFEPA